MLGFAFGCIYFLLEMLAPGCFSVNTAKMDASDTPDLMYFSFVTLATLGYGDITPVARISRVGGTRGAWGDLYMAVFMARLVSMASGPAPAAGPGDTDHRLRDASSEWTQTRKTRL